MSSTPEDDAVARAERKAARRAKKAAHAQAQGGAAPEPISVPVEQEKRPKKVKEEPKEETETSSTSHKSDSSGTTSSTPKSRHGKRKAREEEDEVEEPVERTAADEEFMRQVRTSLDINREYFPRDARKSLEKPPTASDMRSSVEFRRSFDVSRETADSSRSTRTSIDKETGATARRASLEKEMEHGNEDDDLLNSFPISEGLSSEQAHELLKEYGRNELPEKTTPKWLIFLSLLWQPMPIMIWIAAIIEGALENFIDMGVLIAINLINACLGYYETTKAGDAVAALKASLKPTAICFRDGKWDNTFDARLLVPGDLVELAAGAAVPADCMINTGTIDVDESAMTGESLPVTLHERQMAKMGGTVARGETHATVVLTGKNTFFGKTASMLGGSGGYSNLQKLLLKIIIILCVLAFFLCGAALIYLAIRYKSFKNAVSFAVIVIVASIPMAVEIVTTSTLAIGSRQLSKHGAIVSRLAAIEDLAGLNMLCSDKTGTLTKNKMTIQPDAPCYEKGLTQMDLLKQAALAAKWESPPKDALDTLFLRCHLWVPNIHEIVETEAEKHPDWKQADKDDFYNKTINDALQKALEDYESLAFMPFDPRIKRTESTVRQKSTGRIYKITKGAPHVIQQLDSDTKKGDLIHEKVEELGEDGIRAVALAVSEDLNGVWKEDAEEQDPNMKVTWHLTGLLTFLDPPRDDTKDTIARAQAYGVPVRMITGDHLLIARKTARDLDMGVKSHPNWPYIEGPDQLPMLDEDGKPPKNLVDDYGPYIKNADGFAQVFPEHKFLIVETYRRLGFKCGMTGDGVNDAPALKRADVGIAVAGATDAARAAADIVLTQEGLATIVLGLEISRVIFARMKSFLTYRIAATLQLLFFFFIAAFAFEPVKYVEKGLPRNNTTPAVPLAPGVVPVAVPTGPVAAPPPTIPGSQEWPVFFSLPVIYLIIITVINDGTLIAIGYDHAVPSQFPERWVLPVLFIVASALAAIACFSSLLWLWWCLDSWRPGSFFQKIGIGGIDNYGHIVNMIFLKVAVSDILTLFSSRTSQQFFFQRAPHFMLMLACLLALCITTTLALVWPCGKLDERPVCGLAYKDGKLLALWVWIYCIIVFLVQDVIKVLTWRIILYFNMFNINNTVDTSVLGTNDVELENTKHADPKKAHAAATPAIHAPPKAAKAHANGNGDDGTSSYDSTDDSTTPSSSSPSSTRSEPAAKPASKTAAKAAPVIRRESSSSDEESEESEEESSESEESSSSESSSSEESSESD